MRPQLSVIMASYNGANYLAEAFAGLHAQGPGLEILVIDDSSTDDSPMVARSLGATVHCIPHSGQARARNYGLALAKGNFIMFHDQDDVLHADSLPRMLGAMSEMPELPAVLAQAQDFLSPELAMTERHRLRPHQTPYFGYLGATLFRKETLLAVGGFSEALRAGEAADLMLRIQNSGTAPGRLSFVAMRRRIHGNNASRLMRGQQFAEYASSLRKRLHPGD